MEIKEKIKFYADIFQAAFEITANEEASCMITQEIGKDLRQSLIPDNKMPQFNLNKSKSEPATEKQVIALKKYGLYKDGLSKEDAKKLISDSINKV